MIAVLVLLGVAVVGLAGALVAQGHQFARERSELIDVIVAKHAGELRAVRTPAPPPPEARDFKRELDADLRAMGLDPADVPALPHGL